MGSFASRIALASSDSLDALRQLAEIDSRYDDMPTEERPEPLATFGLIFSLYSCVTVDGAIWRFIHQSEGSGFHQAIDACRRIGALDVAALLENVARQFPGGRVPRDHDERLAIAMGLSEDADASGDDDPVAVSDKALAGAMPALASTMRRWVAEHASRLARELEALQGADDAPASPTDVSVEAALAGLRVQHSRLADVRDTQIDELWAAAKAVRLVPWRDKGMDPRYTEFLAAVSGFGGEIWQQVALRVLADAGAVDAAQGRQLDLFRLISESGRLANTRFTAAWHRSMNAHNEVLASIHILPKKSSYNGKSIGLRAAAQRGFVPASTIMALHDWAVLVPSMHESMHVAYGLFAGLAPCPTIPDSRA